MFAVLGFVTPKGEARTAGIVYVVRNRRLYIGSVRSAWKTRHVERNPDVSLTVTIPKRVPLLPWIKIPAATITFQGEARVRGFEEVAEDVRRGLTHGVELSADYHARSCVIEVIPRGDFITYGVGVSLLTMRKPEAARGRAPV
jgi:hypothetical protein